MSNFAIFAFTWPVVGTVFLCAFGMFLARRDRALYDRTQVEAARRQAEGSARVAATVPQSEPMRADA
jgi:hypothetical protein